MKYSFIEYMSYKLKKYGKKTEKYLEIADRLEKIGLTKSQRNYFTEKIKGR